MNGTELRQIFKMGFKIDRSHWGSPEKPIPNNVTGPDKARGLTPWLRGNDFDDIPTCDYTNYVEGLCYEIWETTQPRSIHCLLRGETHKTNTKGAQIARHEIEPERVKSVDTNFDPRLRHFLWLGTNLFPLFKAAWSLNDPELMPPFAGERFNEATVSLTDSFELEELDADDGGSSWRDNLKNEKKSLIKIFDFSKNENRFRSPPPKFFNYDPDKTNWKGNYGRDLASNQRIMTRRRAFDASCQSLNVQSWIWTRHRQKVSRNLFTHLYWSSSTNFCNSSM